MRANEDNSANQDWWEQNPMFYDWDNPPDGSDLTAEFFKKIDTEFASCHALLNNPDWPRCRILENFIDYGALEGKKVLEIGCGGGLVASDIARSGAKLTAIDLTQTAINTTTERFSQMKLKGDIRQADAENMPFNDASFEFVVSWGVIHHSGNMQKIVDEIYRVLKPGGRAFIMVYSKNSLRYRIFVPFWLGVMRGKLLTSSVEEIAGQITDGAIARHLDERMAQTMFAKFAKIDITYTDEEMTTLKYLFGVGRIFNPFRAILRPFQRFLASRYGWYMQLELTR